MTPRRQAIIVSSNVWDPKKKAFRTTILNSLHNEDFLRPGLCGYGDLTRAMWTRQEFCSHADFPPPWGSYDGRRSGVNLVSPHYGDNFIGYVVILISAYNGDPKRRGLCSESLFLPTVGKPTRQWLCGHVDFFPHHGNPEMVREPYCFRESCGPVEGGGDVAILTSYHYGDPEKEGATWSY